MKLDFHSLYTQSEGRLDRMTFWLAGIILACIYLIVKYIAGLLTVVLVSVAPQQLAQVVGFIINTLVPFVFIFPAYCLLLKRGRDRNRPDWIAQVLALFVAIVYLLPKLVVLIMPQETARNFLQTMANGFWLIFLILAIAAGFLLVDYGLREGDRG